MNLLVDIDQWIINHAAYPGLFAIFLGLFLGTVIIPETWPFVRKRLLGVGARQLVADFNSSENQSARADFMLLIYRAYKKYNSKKELRELLDGYEFPNDFPPNAGPLYNYSYIKNVDSQNLWDFFICLFSDAVSGNDSGLVSARDAMRLLEAGRISAKFWDKWARELKLGTVRYPDMHPLLFSNMRSIKAVTLSEMAIAHVMPIDPGAGKVGLFELTTRPAQLAPKNSLKRFLTRMRKTLWPEANT